MTGRPRRVRRRRAQRSSSGPLVTRLVSAGHRAQHHTHVLAKLIERTFGGDRSGADQQPAVGEQGRSGDRGDHPPEAAAHPVAHDRGTNRTPDRVRDPRRHDPGLGKVATPEVLGAGFDAIAGQTLECSSLVQSTDRQADSLARPFSRRVLMIARPARVRMRARNPCLRARRRVLGWKVRFTATPEIHG